MSRLDKPSKMSKKIITIIISIIVVLGLIAGVYMYARQNMSASQSATSTGEDVLSQAKINKAFTFKAQMANNKKEDIKLTITSAEKRKEVLIQGKPASAKGDKVFLILNLELDNTSETAIKYLAPVDLFRLEADGGKKYAPDVHSELVEVQPISTKITRIGFVVDQSQSKFKIQVGELDGKKEVVEMSL